MESAAVAGVRGRLTKWLSPETQTKKLCIKCIMLALEASDFFELVLPQWCGNSGNPYGLRWKSDCMLSGLDLGLGSEGGRQFQN